MTRTAITYPRIPINGAYIPGSRAIEASAGDTAITTQNWIESRNYKWVGLQTATAWAAEFDTAVTRTGTRTLKLSNTDATGRCSAALCASSSLANVKGFAVEVLPSTQYVFSCYVKTNNVAANGAFVTLREYNPTPTAGADTVTNKLAGTVDWTLCTATFTTAADTIWLDIILRLNVAGNISDGWYDVNSMTLVSS